jgi:hypothetical protein
MALTIKSLILSGQQGESDGASERDRTSDLLITNHARFGPNCKRNNLLRDYFRKSCSLYVHFYLCRNDRPNPMQDLQEGGKQGPKVV